MTEDYRRARSPDCKQAQMYDVWALRAKYIYTKVGDVLALLFGHCCVSLSCVIARVGTSPEKGIFYLFQDALSFARVPIC